MDTDKIRRPKSAHPVRFLATKERKSRKMKDLHAAGTAEAKPGALSKNRGFWRGFTPFASKVRSDPYDNHYFWLLQHAEKTKCVAL